jgi:hypothetical protein
MSLRIAKTNFGDTYSMKKYYDHLKDKFYTFRSTMTKRIMKIKSSSPPH